jgi:hypothetical protein
MNMKQKTVDEGKAPAPKKAKPPEEALTFTTTKRKDGFFFCQSVFNYVDGRRTGLKKEGVYIELARGEEFKPRAFCEAFNGAGWRPGELASRADELVKMLKERAENRSTHTIRWKDRVRPINQVLLEEENDGLRNALSESEAMMMKLAAHLPKDGLPPEILELKKLVEAQG